uniref:Uncharacterized protein n=1 Tax=Cacopsylla melanoneura TaxID=428564 RepID=A0A8D8M4R7_9HEMI
MSTCSSQIFDHEHLLFVIHTERTICSTIWSISICSRFMHIALHLLFFSNFVAEILPNGFRGVFHQTDWKKDEKLERKFNLKTGPRNPILTLGTNWAAFLFSFCNV